MSGSRKVDLVFPLFSFSFYFSFQFTFYFLFLELRVKVKTHEHKKKGMKRQYRTTYTTYVGLEVHIWLFRAG